MITRMKKMFIKLGIFFFILLLTTPIVFAQGLVPEKDEGEICTPPPLTLTREDILEECITSLQQPPDDCKCQLKMLFDKEGNSLPCTPKPSLQAKIDMMAKERDKTYTAWLKTSKTLGCKIDSGTVDVKGVKSYILWVIDYLIGLSGLVAVLFIVIGGYQYVFGGIVEKKEEGKNTIMYAIIGITIVLLAWIIVEIVQRTLTS